MTKIEIPGTENEKNKSRSKIIATFKKNPGAPRPHCQTNSGDILDQDPLAEKRQNLYERRGRGPLR